MITVARWDRSVSLGAAVLVALTVTSARPLAAVSIDLIGDGLPGVTVQLSGNSGEFGGLGIVARRAGTFELAVDAVDALGCVGRTGLRRTVTVFSPGSSGDDFVQASERDSKRLGDLAIGDASTRIPRAHIRYKLGGVLDAAVRKPVGMAPLGDHVAVVVSDGSEKQVVRPATKRRVATMAHAHAVWDWTKRELIGQPMRAGVLLAPRHEPVPIPCRQVPVPEPATICCFRDVAPQSLCAISGPVSAFAGAAAKDSSAVTHAVWFHFERHSTVPTCARDASDWTHNAIIPPWDAYIDEAIRVVRR